MSYWDRIKMYFDIKERTDTEYVQIKINVNELKIIQRRIKQNEKVCFLMHIQL